MINTLLRSAAGLVIAASATIVTIVGSAAPVSAAEAPGFAASATIAIYTNGVDLASPAGFAAVEARIKSAARRVCDDRGDRSVNAHQKRQKCIATAINAAMPRLELLAAADRDARTDVAEASAPTSTVRR
jgi:UrcA family protein